MRRHGASIRGLTLRMIGELAELISQVGPEDPG